MQRRRQLMGMQTGGLPGTHRAVEYIEGTGTQYIATDYVPTADETSTDFIYQYTIMRSSDDMIYGINTGSVAYYAEEYNAGRWYAAVGLSRYSNIQWSRYGSNLYKTHAVIDLEKITITNLESGVTRTANRNQVYSSFTNTLPLYIFAWNGMGRGAEYIHRGLKMFSLKLYRAGKISADFVPCVRKSDNKPGMYDAISKTFYTNAGTGEFIVPN